MRRISGVVLGVVAGLGMAAITAMAAAADEKVETAGTPGAAAAEAPRFAVGTRITYFWLLDDERSRSEGSYLGALRRLDDVEDLLPIKIYGQWFFHPNWGLELSWDEIQFETYNKRGEADVDAEEGSDGEADYWGPILLLVGRYPNETVATPFGGIGFGYFFGDFEENTWWHLNYASEEAWNELGRPDEKRNGYTRNIEVEDATAFVVQAGCDFYFNDRWSADVIVRYLNGTSDATFHKERKGVEQDTLEGEFPLESFWVGAGVKYSF